MPDTPAHADLLEDFQRVLAVLEAHGLPLRTAYLGGVMAELRGELSGIERALAEFDGSHPEGTPDALVEKTRIICSRLLTLPEFDEFTRSGSLLAEEAGEVLTSARSIEEYTRQFETRLEQSESRLDTAESPEDVRNVVTGIRERVHELADFNRNLCEKLQESTKAIQVLGARLEEIRNLANTDELTGLFNRRHFENQLTGLLRPASGQVSARLCLIYFDIDGFKGFNDRFGHAVGDMVLKTVARILVSEIRDQDFSSRYGGDEFVVALPDIFLDDAKHLANRLGKRVAATQLRQRGSKRSYGKLTISMGLARYKAGDTVERIVDRADKAMLDAKRSGRNRLVVNAS